MILAYVNNSRPEARTCQLKTDKAIAIAWICLYVQLIIMHSLAGDQPREDRDSKSVHFQWQRQVARPIQSVSSGD